MALGAVQYFPAVDDADDGSFIPIAEFLLHVRQLGIVDRKLLAALETVPRTLFLGVEAGYGPLFSDRAQPIDCGQMNTPPLLAARAIQALAPTPRDRLLEIGTGTGYLSAVLSLLVRRVYTVDRFRTLVMAAQSRFETIGADNITSIFADGTYGWAEKGPFDKIVVTASAEAVPKALIEQLSTNGILVMPIGPADGLQTMTRFERVDRNLVATPICPVRVVPLIPGKAARL
ncbi:protein-L-isoaspartate(D-aspartate) O-methyltransferase [Kaistia dalseonensis]|uniref:Protein-L-isoaspartate O-methyltransferase n=1 Tax=Kaistia dalseonensis TaxID=410840 RepID=A0ABU0H1H8_9HYPH|nr:protein-L-isoaspartate(D-aspartate) O-methyltransferase [Kaistia dalseonensis]MCX5493602.1 protein-L-isoaspartate(D-aspartate) O-methyltransferase [Kaistia dalseonensis]MDQ0436163.1 protein-L-isoaspartate(D-aspartate) O-methyltransferase [Kaistia dalseonensis]